MSFKSDQQRKAVMAMLSLKKRRGLDRVPVVNRYLKSLGLKLPSQTVKDLATKKKALFFHVTSRKNISSIKKRGLIPGGGGFDQSRGWEDDVYWHPSARRASTMYQGWGRGVQGGTVLAGVLPLTSSRREARTNFDEVTTGRISSDQIHPLSEKVLERLYNMAKINARDSRLRYEKMRKKKRKRNG